MAGKSAVPLLLGVGAIALLAGGKKKKKKAAEYETPPGLGEDEDYTPYIPPSPPPKPPPGTPSKPAGSPPRGDSYDGEYWGSTGEERLRSIRQHFIDLGYTEVNPGPWPMNKLGPKGTTELTNEDGTKGKLGGKDDEPNATVSRFQREYNAVSKLNKADKIFPGNLGGLDIDGKVGPYTLNGLRYVTENMPGGKRWPDLVQQASIKGINA